MGGAALAELFARQRGGDATALAAADAQLLATRGGASALGRDDLGTFEPGAWADVVHVDTADAAFVDPGDDVQLVSNLVWSAGIRGVRDVWVAGHRVLSDGGPARIDPAEVLHGARRVASKVKN